MIDKNIPNTFARRRRRLIAALAALGIADAQASIFSGETLDAVANAISWVVLVIVPITVITVFWLVHILPEKVAEKRKHPQAKAIQTLCLLSLAFGGLLWPLAWIWAYTKPVLYKMAYGTDVDEHHAGDGVPPPVAPVAPAEQTRQDVARLRQELARLEARLDQEARG